MAANPFLFSEETYSSPSSAASNPFLVDDDEILPQNNFQDNPFLSQTATTISTTNPFSFDPMELEPAEAEVPYTQQNLTSSDPFGNIDTTNIINTPFSTTESINTQPVTVSNDLLRNERNETSPQKPSDLDLKYSHSEFNNGPPRPPPPRPLPPKETQDLLMSVMGAMDATSSTLLDKIPPTRTPSPVSMRDLHSPCPTPEPTFGDLLDVGDKNDIPNTTPSNKELSSLEQDNFCDINQNPAVNFIEESVPPQIQSAKPPRPSPPVRPPKPPLPPSIINATPKESTHVPVNNSVPTYQQPAQVTQPIVNAADEIDLFGVETVPQKHVSNFDILNLYNTPKQEPIKDLLCDTVESDIIMPSSNDNVTSVLTETSETKEDNKLVSPTSHSNDLLKDNFISPEPSQDDLKMDLSESQSRDSVSSVTLNPFAVSEEVTPQYSTSNQNNIETENIVQQEEKSMDIFNVHAEEVSKESNFILDDFGSQPSTDTTVKQNSFGIINESLLPQDDFSSTTSVPTVPNVPVIQDPFGFANDLSTTQDAFGLSNVSTTQHLSDDFDEFSKKFDSVKTDSTGGSAWGSEGPFNEEVTSGFGQDDGFDAFLALQEPPCVPQSTPNRVSKAPSQESDEDKDFSVFIRPKAADETKNEFLPTIAPPPVPQQAAFVDTSPRFNPFDNQNDVSAAVVENETPFAGEMTRTDSQETPPTPLFDEDVSQPLQPFPRMNFTEEGWEMQLRQPNKKKITGQRFWKKIFVKLVHQPDCVLLQLYNQKDDKDPFQELPLQPCYSVSEIGAQQYDQFGKIFTVKLQYIFYKERPGVRPGQVKKAERITNKLSQFAAYAIQGDYQGVKEFGSDLKKLGLPVEHAPQVSQLMKLGSLNFEDLKQFSFCIEEALFRLQAHRDRALHYKMEEVQITAVDELYVEQDAEGHIDRQIARVRLFFLGFLTGMPDVELGVNDMRRQGKEVVGRHDIIPVVTEEWIRLEDVEFHSCVQQEDYHETHIIKFKPPDACYIELMRFRVRPPKNRELPLQLKAQICITGYKVELRADVLVPGFTSRKLGQVPCEDVMIRFPIPECWIYMFRVEKHFRYGSVKSAHRRTGKVKGIERILGTIETLQENLIEVTSGQAKYEHQHRAIVWRCPRLPKEGQGAYTTHNMVCRIALTSYDQMPDKLAEYCFVEFTMPATQVSHTTCRSVSMQNSDSDEPPEKYVRYLARHEYRVGIERTEGDNPNPYATATYVGKQAPAAPPPETPQRVVEESSSDSD